MSDDDFKMPDLPSDEELGIEGLNLDDFEGELPDDGEDLLADIDLGDDPASKDPAPTSAAPPPPAKKKAEDKDARPESEDAPQPKSGAAWAGPLVVVLLMAVGWLSLSERALPSAVPATAADSVFSSGRAMETIHVIAAAPHAPGSPEHARVRQYLVERLNALGLEPEIQTSTFVAFPGDNPRAVTIRNIVARIPGTASTGAIVLTAHYDARELARGAGDDATGVASILETVRVIQQSAGLQNDLIILITDAEELGLVGARAFVDEHPWMSDVRLVLSVEMRGGGGVSAMFETSPENGWIIDALKASDPRPSATSLSLEVYRRMGNDTDFSPFRDAGVQGLNFAGVGRANVYHQNYDDPDHLNEPTLQHHGMRLLAVTQELGNRDLGLVNAPDKTYFTVPLLGLITYSNRLVLPMAGGLVVGMLVVGFFLLRGKKKVAPLVGFVLGLVSIGLASLVGWGLMSFLSPRHPEYGALHGSAFHFEGFYVLGMFGLVLATVATVFGLAQRKYSAPGLAYGALMIPFSVAVATAFTAPGAAMVFQWPAVGALVGIVVLGLLKRWDDGLIQRILVVICMIPALVFMTLLVEWIWLGLTLRVAPILAGTMALSLLLLLPVLKAANRPNGWWLPVLALLVSVGLVGAGTRGAVPSAEAPAPSTLLYALDRGTADRAPSAVWASSTGSGFEWAQERIVDAAFASSDPAELFGAEAGLGDFLVAPRRRYRVESAAIMDVPVPHVEALERGAGGNLRVSVIPSMQSEMLGLRLISGGRFVSVAGRPTGGSENAAVPSAALGEEAIPYLLHFGAPDSTLVVEIEPTPGASVLTVEVVEHSLRAGELLGESFFQRPPELAPDITKASDRVMVRSAFQITRGLADDSVALAPGDSPRLIDVVRPLFSAVDVDSAADVDPGASGEGSALSGEGSAVSFLLDPDAPLWQAGPDLPRPVSNNAVVGVETARGPAVFSLLGLDESKEWDGVVNWAFRWNTEDDAWTEVTPVPGPGRLASTAQAVGGKIYLFGGYTVAEDGTEVSVPNVDVYDPATDTWSAAAPMPIPVDDAVSGLWRDSLIVLVSGWHDDGNVSDVQWYDPAANQWLAATPIPGDPVFGHAGGIARDVIVYRDGAAVVAGDPKYQLAGSAWKAQISPDDPTRLTWSPAPRYPGPALYRAAAVGLDDWVVFVGGTDNPYNYTGVGYDGVPAEARADVVAFQTRNNRWVRGPSLPVPSMDHRTVGVAGDALILAGGLDGSRNVTSRVFVASKRRLLTQLKAVN